MPLLPAHTLLQAYSLVLAFSGYLLLTSPVRILGANSLWLLGEAMHIRRADFTSTGIASIGSDLLPKSTRELLALIAVILVAAAITQSLLSTPLRYSSTDLLQLAKQSTNQARPQHQREQDTSSFAEKLYNLHTTQTLFLTLSGIKVLAEGVLIATIYLFYSERSSPRTHFSAAAPIEDASIFALLSNRIVFTVAMADMLFWGYLWTVLREEARELAEILAQRRKLVDERNQ